MSHRALTLFGAMLCSAAALAAEPKFVLRIATVAPEGTAWAREIRAMARDVESDTHGEVRLKFYMGGIAGNEIETGARMRRGQLDGVASGGMLCQRLAPSWKITRAYGLFQSRDEISFTLGRLRSTLDEEFKKGGHVLLGWASLGTEVVLTPRPVTSLAELRPVKLWRWDLDEVGGAFDRLMGLSAVPMSVEASSTALDQHKVDGLMAVSAAFLAFQWHKHGGFIIEPRLAFLYSCLVVTSAAFDKLPIEHQKSILSASAKLAQRVEEVANTEEGKLHDAFVRQGLVTRPMSEAFVAELRNATRAALDQIPETVLQKPLIARTRAILEEYRAAHPAAGKGAK